MMTHGFKQFIWLDNPCPLPLGSQWLTLMAPTFVRGRQIELRSKTAKNLGAIPKPIPPLTHVVVSSIQHTNSGDTDPDLLSEPSGKGESSKPRRLPLSSRWGPTA